MTHRRGSQAIEYKVISTFPSRTEVQLLHDICEARKKHCVHVSAFKRFGFSGARLLLVHFSDEAAGLPYLLKISRYSDIVEEFDAIQSMGNLVRDCTLVVNTVFQCNDLDEPAKAPIGALLYPHLGTDDPSTADDSVTLRQLLYDRRCPTSRIVEALTAAYQALNLAHSAGRTTSVLNPRRHYYRYLRKHKSVPRIKGLLGNLFDVGSGTFLGAQIRNPLLVLKRLPSSETFQIARVHGDFHPDNIVMHETRRPHIIDFAWCKEPRDVLVDYTLMELSVRLMCLPRTVCLEDQRLVDTLLLEDDGCERVLEMRFKVPETNRLLHRMATIVKTIRSCARSTYGPDFHMRCYLLSQFLVLYGLLRYESYDGYCGSRLLSMIGTKLAQDTRWMGRSRRG